MSQWTNECAILRDLSVAQGRVPVAIENTVGAGDKPPSLDITEETEEEYFKHCSAAAYESVAPDLGLIQKMLDMVRDTDEMPKDEDTNKIVVISKLSPHCPEFKPSQENTSTPTDQSPTKQIKEKKKRQRNIALESILQAIEDNKIHNKEIILRKPNEFIAKAETVEIKQPEIHDFKEGILSDSRENTTPTAVEKVNGWLETQTDNPFPKKSSKVTLEATSIVFKKKEKVKKIDKHPKNLKYLEMSPTSSFNSGEYKPSTLANEYYLKYVERNKFKESVRENIWTKAEQRMKEIDEKRRHEAMQNLISVSSESQDPSHHQSFEETQNTDIIAERIIAATKINRCLELIALPQHRHQLSGDCLVCEAVNKPKIPKKVITDCESANILEISKKESSIDENEKKPVAPIESTNDDDDDGNENNLLSTLDGLCLQVNSE